MHLKRHYPVATKPALGLHKFLFHALLVLGFVPNALASDGTVMGNTAESITPGTCVELTTIGLSAAINDSGSSQHILTYATDAKWNPSSRELFFIGGDHNGGSERFIRYSAVTNTWTIETHPTWMATGVNQNHGYDYGATDATKGYYFYTRHRYDITRRTWDQLPTNGLPSFGRGHSAYEYFPELGGYIVIGDGGVYLLRDGASSWTQLAAGVPMAGLHPVAEYSPVHKVLLFGGGDATRTLHKLDASGNVVPIAAAPFAEISVAPAGTILTVDPVSGDFLVLTDDAEFWRYGVASNSWTRLSPSLSPFSAISGTSKVNNVIASPISNYGVTLFVMWAESNNSKVLLHKHSSSSQTPICVLGTRPNSPALQVR